mmetsp:Transcript_18180/g.28506  ORF Transcript_18180/g.28506 Transcript_18180/m.28506 type:complete len:260 (-) Transcript_18180:994-1773(-)
MHRDCGCLWRSAGGGADDGRQIPQPQERTVQSAHCGVDWGANGCHPRGGPPRHRRGHGRRNDRSARRLAHTGRWHVVGRDRCRLWQRRSGHRGGQSRLDRHRSRDRILKIRASFGKRPHAKTDRTTAIARQIWIGAPDRLIGIHGTPLFLQPNKGPQQAQHPQPKAKPHPDWPIGLPKPAEGCDHCQHPGQIAQPFVQIFKRQPPWRHVKVITAQIHICRSPFAAPQDTAQNLQARHGQNRPPHQRMWPRQYGHQRWRQ